MYLLLIFAPLFGSFSCGLLGRVVGSAGSIVISCLWISVSWLFSCVVFYEVGLSGCPVYLEATSWMSIGSLWIEWSFLYDSLASIMCVIVTTVSLLVHIYSIGYMKEDPHVSRFFSYLSLFTFFMLMLVTSGNLVQLFVGWEGVGICSYLLINFWYTRVQANKAALKAVIVNRVGDLGVILGMILIYYLYSSVEFGIMFSLTPYLKEWNIPLGVCEVNGLYLVGVLLFVGVMGKSAQIGLHTWLPDAMEGPTPVSALIHAATMVTAGVFLLLRLSPLYESVPSVLVVVAVVGAMTTFFAAITGSVQNDLKKVVAYSTCSQLGYMVFACGLSNYGASAFHLFNHAFFKALLFLGAGSIIHALLDEQDMRRMGGLAKALPLTYISMLIGSTALMGVAPLAGFYSKDYILENAYGIFEIHGTFSYWLGVVSVFFTAYYSMRLVLLVFITDYRGSRTGISSLSEGSVSLLLPLVALSVMSLLVGYLFRDMFVGLGTSFWNGALSELKFHSIVLQSEFSLGLVKVVPIVFTLAGGSLFLVLYQLLRKGWSCIPRTYFGYVLYLFLSRKWFFDTLYSEWVSRRILFLGYEVTYKLLDQGFLELLGSLGSSRLIREVSSKVSDLQSGYLYHMSFLVVLGFSVISFVCLLPSYLGEYLVLLWIPFGLIVLLQ